MKSILSVIAFALGVIIFSSVSADENMSNASQSEEESRAQKLLDIRSSEVVKKEKLRAQKLLNIRLFEAVRMRDLRFIKKVVENGADVNAINYLGVTVFSSAIKLGASDKVTEIVKYLVKEGAEINKKSGINGEMPLHLAAMMGNKKLAKFLLLRNAEINTKTIHGATPLYLAVSYKKAEMAKYLVGEGAAVNEKANYNLTVMHLLANSQDLELVRFFLNLKPEWRRGDLNSFDTYGNSPLHHAIQSGNLEVFKIFVRSSPKTLLNKVNSDDWTVLHFASLYGDLEAVQLLLDRKVNLNTRNNSQRTALDEAKYGNHEEVIELLEKAGAE